jgi:hypothetical protein
VGHDCVLLQEEDTIDIRIQREEGVIGFAKTPWQEAVGETLY